MPTEIHLLHVDDDAAFRDLTAELLERVGSQITVHSESDPATVSCRVASEPIDCVISDYQMPQMNGVDLLREVRTTHPDLPFFLFTSTESDEVVDAALAADVTDIVIKEPGLTHFKILANRVSNAVEHYQGKQRPDESIETC